LFRLELLPACEGDCLILTWGDAARPRRILIDAGRKKTARFIMDYVATHSLSDGSFELFIITHIDRDHIEGAVPLLRSASFRRLVKEVWFNGRKDLIYARPQSMYEEFGALDGERITQALTEHRMAWNTRWGPKPVAITDRELPSIELPDGLRLTLLSPDAGQLADLAKPWDETIEASRPGWEAYGPADPVEIRQLAAMPFKGDRARPNASSIALLADYDGKSIVLAGDAHADRLSESLGLYSAAGASKSKVVLVKAPHHGSRGNISAELVQALNCSKWAFSTNGDQFSHPDAEAVARVLVNSPPKTTLFFNYETIQTSIWKRPVIPHMDFAAIFGNKGYISIDLEH
jgi:ribonuclease BN (tRNA processing enzyme)